MGASGLAQGLAILAAGYAGLVVVAFALQGRLVYFPDQPAREVTRNPGDIGLDYEAVTLETSDGVRLDGWFVAASPERGVVAFFHGNAGNIGHRLDTLRILNRLGLSVLMVDYRGYGRSEGQPSEAGTYRDAEAAWHFLVDQRGVPPGRIVLFGRSLGAAVAAHLATRHRPGALILESAFTSIPDLAARIYPFLPVRWISRFRYDTRAYAGRVSCPTLVIHSRDDTIVPIGHGRAILAELTVPHRFLEIGGDHNTGFLNHEQEYMEGLEAFLAAHLPPVAGGGQSIPKRVP
jgi:hypothetical protein